MFRDDKIRGLRRADGRGPRRVGGRKFWRAAAALCGVAAVALAGIAWQRASRPRAWAAGELPVAFWVWRDELPAEVDVTDAAAATRARVLFVRAGQLHAEGGRVTRVRAPRGRFPRALPVQLVYNATRPLLDAYAELDAAALRACVVETYEADSRRAALDGARVAGLQLDLDVPTRLLPAYAALLKELRPHVAARGAQLSVTGLPTWMDSPALAAVLAEVDFWIPQFYGARIPARLTDSVPISRAASVAAGVERARRLGRPFYAGLAAYGYAALYARGGALAELRGDIAPARVASDPRFELIERRAFDAGARVAETSEGGDAHTSLDARAVAPNSGRDARADGDAGDDGQAQTKIEGNDEAETKIEGAAVASHWRYVFRAREDASVDGLEARAGEHLIFDAPSAAALRASVRAARESGGARLLGLCLFRLPTRGDETTLTLKQIAAALADRPAAVWTRVGLRADAESPGRLVLTAENAGASGALAGESVSVTLAVPAGSVQGVVSLEGFADVETLCGAVSVGGSASAAPCGLRRASLLRFNAHAWPPGARARAALSLVAPPPARLQVHTRLRADDGRLRHTLARTSVTRARDEAASGDERSDGDASGARVERDQVEQATGAAGRTRRGGGR